MLDVENRGGPVLTQLRDVVGDRAGYEAGRRDRDGAEDSDRLVDALGDERARRDGPAVLGRCQQAHLGHGLVGDVAQVHERPDGEAESLDHVRRRRRSTRFRWVSS